LFSSEQSFLKVLKRDSRSEGLRLALVPLKSVYLSPSISGETNPQQGGTLPQLRSEWEIGKTLGSVGKFGCPRGAIFPFSLSGGGSIAAKSGIPELRVQT
jgi:hypothetical protein